MSECVFICSSSRLLYPARLPLSQQSSGQEVAAPLETIAPDTGKPVRGHVVYVCDSSC